MKKGETLFSEAMFFIKTCFLTEMGYQHEIHIKVNSGIRVLISSTRNLVLLVVAYNLNYNNVVLCFKEYTTILRGFSQRLLNCFHFAYILFNIRKGLVKILPQDRISHISPN